MLRFSVYYVVKDWVEVNVKAKNAEEAKQIALNKVEKSGYKDKAITVCDGNTEFAGITYTDTVNKIG